MKRIFFALLMSLAYSNNVQAGVTTIQGELKFPCQVKHLTLKLSYKGTAVPVDDDGSYYIQDILHDPFYLLVTDPLYVVPVVQDNNIQHLKLKKEAVFYFYKCTKKRLANGTWSWNITGYEQDSPEAQRCMDKIELQTLLVPLPVELVNKELINVTWKSTDLFVKIPTVSTTTCDATKLNKQFVDAQAGFMGMKAYHGNPTKKTIRLGHSEITLTIP